MKYGIFVYMLRSLVYLKARIENVYLKGENFGTGLWIIRHYDKPSISLNCISGSLVRHRMRLI